MRHFRILLNTFKESFKSVFRNLSLSLASISCITITLILVAISMILSLNVNNFTKNIEEDLTIVVFVERNATDQQVTELQTKIKALQNIESIEFQSKKQVKEEMSLESDIFKNIMDSWDDETNPLQDTIQIKVTDVNSIGKTASEVEKLEYVEIVKYGKGMVEELVKIFNMVKQITIVIVIGLILVTAFLISNTIKITITSRKREIEIMRLVGASNSYIKLPFFFEGMLIGALGSVVPMLFTAYGYVFLYQKLGGQVFTPIIKLVNPDLILSNVLLIILAIGIVVGTFGSYRAVRRYLKI